MYVLCVCVCVCVYVHMHVHVCMHMCAGVYTDTCMYRKGVRWRRGEGGGKGVKEHTDTHVNVNQDN